MQLCKMVSFIVALSVSNADRTDTLKVTSTALNQVFAVPELLEAIILQLSVRNVFGVRRVCATWNTVITSSNAVGLKTFDLTNWKICV